MIVITGRTFDHKDVIRKLGASWDADARQWYCRDDSKLDQFKRLIGCSAAIVDEPKPEPPQPRASFRSSIEEWIREISETETRKEYETIVYGNDQQYLGYFRDKKPRSYFGFSSLGDLVDYIETIPLDKRTGVRDKGFDTDPRRIEWSGTADMNHAISLARNGSWDGAKFALDVLSMLTAEHAEAKRRQYSVTGASVSIGRLLAGNPMHMRQRQKTPGRRVVTLFVDPIGDATIRAETFVIRAAIVAALCDLLEQRGYSCEIVSVMPISKDVFKTDPVFQAAVTLKHAGERLNVNDLIFALGHPSYLRRFVFALICSADELSDIYDTCGNVSKAFDDDNQPGKHEFYIPAIERNPRGKTFIDKAREMLETVLPDGLPITIV